MSNRDVDSNEPSIDDIVASIRRIISDEETKGRRPPPVASAMSSPNPPSASPSPSPSAPPPKTSAMPPSMSPPAAPARNDDILELTEMLNDDGSVTPLAKPARGEPPTDLGSQPRNEPPPMTPFGDLDDDTPIFAKEPERSRAPEPAPATSQSSPPANAPGSPAMGPAATAAPPSANRPGLDPASVPQPSTPQPVRITTAMSNNNPTSSGVTLTPVGSSGTATPPAGGPGLASPQTAGAAASAFDRLTQAALQQNAPPPPPRPTPLPGAGKTVDDLAREMLRPLLQQWIDANLPSMVERLVQQEIQRLTRR